MPVRAGGASREGKALSTRLLPKRAVVPTPLLIRAGVYSKTQAAPPARDFTVPGGEIPAQEIPELEPL